MSKCKNNQTKKPKPEGTDTLVEKFPVYLTSEQIAPWPVPYNERRQRSGTPLVPSTGWSTAGIIAGLVRAP